MKRFVITLGIALSFLVLGSPVYAASSPDIANYTNDTLQIITLLSAATAVFFLVKGGYLYITSVGRPEALDSAKKTIRDALVGLVIVLAAGTIVSTFQGTLSSSTPTSMTNAIPVSQITTVAPRNGLTQVLIDAVSGFMQNIVESSTKPVVDGIVGYLTSTPNLLTNSVVFKFWAICLGIVDSLFVLVVALLGLQFMSASSLGFEEIELKQILPRIGIAFLGANISLFLADYVIITCNTLVKVVLGSTGGIAHAWIMDAINPASLVTGSTPIITLIFLVLFLIIAIVLLLMYIGRLIAISLGAVLSPFIFLLWTLPKFSDFAEIAIKSYIVSVFVIFVHVVVIQLAAAFLTLPENSGNSLISVAVAIGLFVTLLKVPGTMMQMVLYTSRNGTFKKLGGQIINVISTDNPSSASRAVNAGREAVNLPRRVINA